MSEQSSALARVTAAASAPPSDDKLTGIRIMASKARQLTLEAEDVEAKLESLKTELNKLTTIEMPEAMKEAGVEKLSLAAEGNYPAFDLKLQNFYSAGIKSDWPEEKKAAAFELLEQSGAGDIIKATVTVTFNKEDYQQAVALSRQLVDQGLSVKVDRSVHHMTLTSWLKEEVEERKIVPDLEKLGAIVGQVVKIKQAKE